MKRLRKALMFVALVMAASCTHHPQATIEGSITEASGKMLYLDYIGIEHTTTTDSVKLDKKGEFHFRVAQPECFDFYRLRIGHEIVYLSVDSTETLKVTATLPTMSIAYEVEGSEDNIMLRQLVHKQRELQSEVQQLIRQATAMSATQAGIDTLVKNYKRAVRMEYIFPNPGKPYAYFALFQRLGGQFIFTPLKTRDDVRCFAAVATNLDLYYPEAARTRNLKSITLKGMRNTRPVQPVDYSELENKITETAIIDIAWPDIDGTTRRLTDLKGKVVMLDFNVYSHPQSAPRVLVLRDLYDKYTAQGFEIYQVSLDENEHFWKTAVENIPWICVRADEAPYSKEANMYGVRELPTYFLINRAGEVVKRDTMVKDIEKEIQHLLAAPLNPKL